MITLNVNGNGTSARCRAGDAACSWVLRDELGLTGTKFGCGIAQCGACTVHIDGEAMRSCSVPVGASTAPRSRPSRACRPTARHPVQQAWLAEDVPQCGYCQSGQIMAAAAFLKTNPKPTDADIDAEHHQYLPLRHL